MTTATTPAFVGWHRKFKHLRLQGEWFQDASDILHAIEKHLNRSDL
jgi:hypothetical protein